MVLIGVPVIYAKPRRIYFAKYQHNILNNKNRQEDLTVRNR